MKLETPEEKLSRIKENRTYKSLHKRYNEKLAEAQYCEENPNLYKFKLKHIQKEIKQLDTQVWFLLKELEIV